MKAMILAAGRGLRMGQLTKTMPKPLLCLQGKPLITHRIEALQRAGIDEIVINVSYLGEQIEQALGDGSRFGVQLIYSREKTPLETGGGIKKALKWLGHAPFIVVSSDLCTDYDFSQLPRSLLGLAYMVLVDNPSYHKVGDFTLQGKQVQIVENSPHLTYANIAVCHPDLFRDQTHDYFRLGYVYTKAARANLVQGEHYRGHWANIGTIEQLKAVNSAAAAQGQH